MGGRAPTEKTSGRAREGRKHLLDFKESYRQIPKANHRDRPGKDRFNTRYCIHWLLTINGLSEAERLREEELGLA